MSGFDNDVMYAKNADFTSADNQAVSEANGLATNGQLWIGTTSTNLGGTHINVGTITSPLGTLSIGYSSPNITMDLVGGGVAVEHLTGDTGGQLNPDGSNNFNLLGQTAGSTTVFDTIGSGSTIRFEDRSWLSRYVVDTSATVGLRGTYSTLQAAITQAIADGSTGVGAIIYIRPCTISETITVNTASVNILICGPNGINNQNQGSAMPLFSGSFTNSGTGAIAFCDMKISGTLTNSSSGQIYVNNAVITGTLVNSSTGTTLITNSFTDTMTGTLSGGNMNFTSCSVTGTLTFSNNASLQLYYSICSGTLAGTTSGTISLNNSYIPLTANTLAAGTFQNTNSSWGAFNYYGNSSVTYQTLSSSAGNTFQAVRSAVSYVVLPTVDYYIGITSTASARTVTLPSTSVIKNQTYVIKDESGGAGTNNITVTVNGGVKTIDGQVNYVIAANYGAVNVIYDGTNFFSF